MKYIFICYSKCTTCKKAKAWLEENNIEFVERPIKEENPTEKELKDWIEKSKLPIKKFFNTSGLLYKKHNLKENLPIMTDEEKIKLLATDGMLVKRPILVGEDTVLVGFKEEEWEKNLKSSGLF
jgi:arsenate reductase